jgi:FkbM family methyltransferase
MSVSYAQNFEDVVLWRALQDVEKGFYIDIGAQDPVVSSVSLAFYEKGWRGVHVEPSGPYAAALRAARPDETVFQVAIGRGDRVMTLHEVPDSGLTSGEADVAERAAKAGFVSHEIEVPTLSLAALLSRYADRAIHWLKIDVEGMEADVIDSWGDCRVRPWILVVESVMPLGRMPLMRSGNPWSSSGAIDWPTGTA